MKKILILILMMAPLSLFAQKFGYVNSVEIAQVMPEYTKAINELKTLEKQYSDELKHIATEFEKKRNELEQVKDSLPESILQRRAVELEEIYARMEQYRQTSAQSFEQARETKFAAINEKLQKAIQDVGREGTYICVFDLASGIPYISETLCDNLDAKVKAKLGISATAAPVK